MVKSWTIRELTSDEYPGTQLRYEVRDETGETVSLHFWEEDAQQMAAVPDLRSDLRTALEYIAMLHASVVTKYGDKSVLRTALECIAMLHRAESSDDAELDRILSALKRAKGE